VFFELCERKMKQLESRAMWQLATFELVRGPASPTTRDDAGASSSAERPTPRWLSSTTFSRQRPNTRCAHALALHLRPRHCTTLLTDHSPPRFAPDPLRGYPGRVHTSVPSVSTRTHLPSQHPQPIWSKWVSKASLGVSNPMRRDFPPSS